MIASVNFSTLQTGLHHTWRNIFLEAGFREAPSMHRRNPPQPPLQLAGWLLSRKNGAGGLKPGSRKQLTTPNTTSQQAEREKSDSLLDRPCYTAQRNETLLPP